MKPAPIPNDETQRLRALHMAQVLDTPSDDRFERITRMARRMFNVPIALVSLVDSERQWFLSRQGLDATETPRDVSFCGHAIMADRLFVVEDSNRDPRFCDNPLVTGPPYVKFYAGYPLKSSSGHRLGTLCIIDKAPRRFSSADRDMLIDLGQLAEDQLRSVSLAHMDMLTHISNRRGFEVLARQALAASTRAGAPATLLLFDLNGFKRINDELGHDAGDATLVEFARCLLKTCRESDAAGRLGGDEFCMLLPLTDAAGANRVLDRLGEIVAATNAAGRAPGAISFSVGAATCMPGRTETLDELMARADGLMYSDKTRRRQREGPRAVRG
jgi:diguanylate cyclase (GGDEF)-like protein